MENRRPDAQEDAALDEVGYDEFRFARYRVLLAVSIDPAYNGEASAM